MNDRPRGSPVDVAGALLVAALVAAGVAAYFFMQEPTKVRDEIVDGVHTVETKRPVVYMIGSAAAAVVLLVAVVLMYTRYQFSLGKFFGSFLVFATLGLSLVSLIWAFALWEHRVNWTDKQGKDGQPGLLPPLREEFAAQALTVPPDYYRRILGREKLEYHEYYLPLELKWYADELQFVQTGQYRAKNWPDRQMRQLNFDPNTGQPIQLGQVGPDGEFLQMGLLKGDKDQPIVDKGAPINLQPLNKYWADYATKVAQVGEQMVRLKKAAEDDRKATVLLTGERDKDDPTKVVGLPGLQARLESEIAKQKKLEAERMELRPLAINVRVELYILEELRQRLEERIKELEEAKRKRDTTRNDPVRD